MVITSGSEPGVSGSIPDLGRDMTQLVTRVGLNPILIRVVGSIPTYPTKSSYIVTVT